MEEKGGRAEFNTQRKKCQLRERREAGPPTGPALPGWGKDAQAPGGARGGEASAPGLLSLALSVLPPSLFLPPLLQPPRAGLSLRPEARLPAQAGRVGGA